MLTADWVRCTTAAACVKLPASTATKKVFKDSMESIILTSTFLMRLAK